MYHKIILKFSIMVIILSILLPVNSIFADDLEINPIITSQRNGRDSEVPNIQITVNKTSDSIDISRELNTSEYYVEYPVILRYISDSENDTSVLVTLDNPTEISAEIMEDGIIITDQTIVLTRDMDHKVIVRVSAEEHELYGNYVIIFKVMDNNGTIELYNITLTTTVMQYFNIEFVTMENETYSRIFDPNSMINNIQFEEFEVLLKNFGNGPDTVTLGWIEHPGSPNAIPIAWEDTFVEIYHKNGGLSTIDEITIPAYDKLSGNPGIKTILIKVNCSNKEREGIFIIDFSAKSVHQKVILITSSAIFKLRII